MLFRSLSQSRYPCALDTEFVPMIGDVIRIDEKEYELIAIDEGVVTIKRGDELRYYRLFDVEHSIIEGYWISNMCEQVFSPTVNRKLEVYEVQDNVYSYNSLDELKEIYELLGEPFLRCDNTFPFHTLVYRDWETDRKSVV